MAEAFVAMGSNLGDRSAHLRGGRAALNALAQTRVTGASAVYETPPVGEAAKYPFLNAVVAVGTELDPEALMRGLLAIEMAAGRDRSEKWGPRTLDLDLLLYDDRTMQTELLTLPHPRLAEREFVLRPLADLIPDRQPPGHNQTVADLLTGLNESAATPHDLPGWQPTPLPND